MALDTATYLVTRDVAQRSGLIAVRYRIADGRFVLDNKDLSRVRLTAEEYISGLSGVERVSDREAQSLIAENGYQMGEAPAVEAEPETREQETNEEE